MPRNPTSLAGLALIVALAFAPAIPAQTSATLVDPVAMAIATELESLMSPEPAPILGVNIALQ